jgi:hypothetical protein
MSVIFPSWEGLKPEPFFHYLNKVWGLRKPPGPTLSGPGRDKSTQWIRGPPKQKFVKWELYFFCCRTHYGKPHLYREPGLTTEAHFLTAHGFPRESSRQKALDTISTAKGVVCRELALRPTTHVCSEQKLLLAKQGSSATVTTLCVVRLTPGSQHSFKVCGDPWIWLTTQRHDVAPVVTGSNKVQRRCGRYYQPMHYSSVFDELHTCILFDRNTQTVVIVPVLTHGHWDAVPLLNCKRSS